MVFGGGGGLYVRKDFAESVELDSTSVEFRYSGKKSVTRLFPNLSDITGRFFMGFWPEPDVNLDY